MKFLLVYDWVNEGTEFRMFFDTKEQLFEAKAEAEKDFAHEIQSNELILSPAIGYSWAEIDQFF